MQGRFMRQDLFEFHTTHKTILITQNLPIIVISAKELTETESARLKETVASVMKKQTFHGEKLMQEINRALTM